jgi:transcriptional regulator with XRE-family HTH domain
MTDSSLYPFFPTGRTGPRGPDVVDIHAGAVLRAQRALRGLTQKQLGGGIGCTHQQVQKYEDGRNRMAASTLYRSACVLQMPVTAFFPQVPPAAGPAGLEKDELELLRQFRKIVRASDRVHVLALVASAAGYQLDGDD